ncbi:MAG: VanW family protein [Oryzihumus sp.]
MRDASYAYRTNDRRVIPWLLVGLVVLFGGAYAAAYAVSSSRVPRGTTVSGIEIGGLTQDVARARLEDRLSALAARPVTLVANGVRERVVPADAGLGVDVQATLDRAGGGRSWDPTRMWDYFTGGDVLAPVVTVDDAALTAAVRQVAADADEPAKDASVTFADGEALTHPPQDGTVIDQPAAVRLLRGAFLGDDTPVELPTRAVEPAIGKRQLSAAMAAFANPAMSGPVTYQIAGEPVVLRPQDFSQALSMRPAGSRLVPHLDDQVLLAAVRPAMRRVARAPQDATVQLVRGRPTVLPARNGVTYDPKDITRSFLGLAAGTDQGRMLAIRSVAARPEVTTADARAWRITEKVSEFTTHFPHADYRNTNLGRAAGLVNGTVLKPGDTFSLNKTVGERTAANGFTKGFMINDGVFKEDLGGGVSQVATTIFNAAFFAGLEDVEHQPHSFYVDRYPVGREATVAWPTIDLKFKNTTPYGVLVQAWIDPSTPSRQGAMHVRMWSTRYWDIKAGASPRYHQTQPRTRHLHGSGCVPHQGYGGFDVDVYRYFYRHGSSTLDHEETMHTHYTPTDTVICS